MKSKATRAKKAARELRDEYPEQTARQAKIDELKRKMWLRKYNKERVARGRSPIREASTEGFSEYADIIRAMYEDALESVGTMLLSKTKRG